MKIFKKIFSLTVALVIIVNICNLQLFYCYSVDSAISQLDKVAKIISEDELPVSIDYDMALKKGHIERLKDIEPDLNSVIYKNTDGSNSLYYFKYPVKYYDSEGKICDKLSVIEEDENTKDFVPKSSNIQTTFSRNIENGVILKFKEIEVEMIPMFVETDDSYGKLSSNAKQIMYNCGDSVSLDYSLTNQGFKENIVLEKYNNKEQFDFKINTHGMKLMSNSEGKVYFSDKSNGIVAYIGDIIVYDNENHITIGDITFNEVSDCNEYILSIKVDPNYLTSEDTVYPVCIDPTIEINYDNSMIWNINERLGIEYATFSSDNTTNYNGVMQVGKTSSSTISRGLMRFPGLIYLVNLFQMDRSLITSAKVYIRDIGYQSDYNAIRINCHKFNNFWRGQSNLIWSQNSGTNRYNVLPLSYNIISQSIGAQLTPTHTYGFDITSLVAEVWGDAMMADFAWDTGILFKAEDSVENSSNVKYASFGGFNSSYFSPYLVIDYEDPSVGYTYENANISYTYRSEHILNAGTTYTFRTGKATSYGTCDTELFLFKDGMDVSDNSWYSDDISNSNLFSKIEVTIPSDGKYILMAKCYTNPDPNCSMQAPNGYCNIYKSVSNIQNEQLIAENAYLGGYIVKIDEVQSSTDIYNSFTANASSGVDPVMYIISNPSRTNKKVIGYNDDFSQDYNSGDFTWGRNSRVRQYYSENNKPNFVFVAPYIGNTSGNVDIYAMCKGVYGHAWVPNLKYDDSIISVGGTSYAYNCIAYSGGLTNEWIDTTLTSQYEHYLSPWFDSDTEIAYNNFYGNNPPRYYGAVTYELTNSLNNAVICVYKNSVTGKWMHASVKRPGNNTPHGYAWESKMGPADRIFHDLHSLEKEVSEDSDDANKENYYGHIERMYKISAMNTLNLSYEESIERGATVEQNITLLDSQRKYLNLQLSDICSDTIKDYYALYSEWIRYVENDETLKYTSNSEDFLQNSIYESLHSFIEMHPEILFIIIDDYFNGNANVFSNLIINVEFVNKNEYSINLANEIRELNNKICLESLKDGKYIAPSYKNNIKSFLKSLLKPESYELLTSSNK